MKTVLVTGACVNTGVDIVRKFITEGWNVAFTGRSAARVAEAEKNYRALRDNVAVSGFVASSLTEEGEVDEAGVEELFDRMEEAGYSVDAVVFNAADQGLGMTFFESPVKDFERVLTTNVVWNYCLARRATQTMCEKGGGSLVFINSNTAYRAIPDRVAYIASKGAQLGMMRALALDLGKYGIRVNAVLPGMIKTDRWEKNPDFYATVPSRWTPLGEVAVGADVAEAAYLLPAHAPNTTGAELSVDGGNMIQLYPLVPENK